VAPSTVLRLAQDDSDSDDVAEDEDDEVNHLGLEPGVRVRVRWTPSSSYEGVFVEYTQHEKYSVQPLQTA